MQAKRTKRLDPKKRKHLICPSPRSKAARPIGHRNLKGSLKGAIGFKDLAFNASLPFLQSSHIIFSSKEDGEMLMKEKCPEKQTDLNN